MDRIYIVTDTTTNEAHYIEAASQGEALRLVIGTRFTARAAKVEDMLQAMQSGAKVVTRMHQGGGDAE